MEQITPPFDFKYLENKNRFPNETEIIFEEEGHLYKCWNRIMNAYVSTSSGNGSIEVDSTTTIIKMMFYDEFDDIAKRILFSDKHKRLVNNPTYIDSKTGEQYKYLGCTTVDEIKSKWGGAAGLGTKMHEIFEQYVNTFVQLNDYYRAKYNNPSYICERNEFLKQLGDYKEINYLLEFMRKFDMVRHDAKIEFFRTEIRMFDPVTNISGTVDLLLKNRETGKYIIVDYKRTHHLKPEPAKKYSYFKNWGRHLDSWGDIYRCSINTYSLQLNLYKFILEQVYGVEVEALYIVAINPKKVGRTDALSVYAVTDRRFEVAIKDLFALRAQCILSDFSETISMNHRKELLKYLNIAHEAHATE